jgi:small subunit ribosomal protein S4
MARYTGPKLELLIWRSNIRDDKAFERRSYPPGQHDGKKREKSEYAIQLMEKKS